MYQNKQQHVTIDEQKAKHINQQQKQEKVGHKAYGASISNGKQKLQE